MKHNNLSSLRVAAAGKSRTTRTTLKFRAAALALAAAALLTGVGRAEACSRVVLTGRDSLTVVGRTLDWRTPIPTNLYVYPRGIAKQAMPSGNTFRWTSRYGSVVAVSYDGGVTEGMNECGLVMNALFCKGSIYRTSPDGKLPSMSLAMLVSYFLDTFATVDEVSAWLAKNEFAIYGQNFDKGTAAMLHWALTDRTGRTLVMEFQNGRLDTYLSSDYRVLTNDPPFPQMLAIDRYWQQVGGANMLPGTVRSADRFVRASFFIGAVPTDVTSERAVAEVLSVLGTVSVPLGYELAGEPNLSSTQWRSVADARGLCYYFGFTTSLSMFWVDLSRADLRAGAPVLKLDTAAEPNPTGCVNGLLRRSEGFKPMW